MAQNSQPTKDRILAAAERLFADHGFDGVSMREIAARANSQLALIHYHFGSKLEVYRAIWATRYTSEVAARREVSLAAVDYKESRPKLIRGLVEIFLLPLFKMKEIDALADFIAIGARESTDPKEAERGILKEFLDVPARRFLDCFALALPELSAAEIAWGYQAMVGVSVLHIADRDRISRISAGAARAGDTKSASGPLVDFCVGGWLALAEHAARKTTKIPKSPTELKKKTSTAIRGGSIVRKAKDGSKRK
jgi:AcrR family transcriptional regulator